MKFKFRVLGIVSAALLLTGFPSRTSASGQNVQDISASRSPQEIREVFKQFRPMSQSFDYMESMDIFEAAPQFGTPMDAGKLKQVYIEDGLKAVNFVRYLAGLPSDVEADWSLAPQEQAAAMANALNGGLSHYPSQPAGMDDALFRLAADGAKSSNLYAGNPTLYSNVTGYMSDSDTSNIDRVGHRRWIINPQMKKTMFGFTFKNGDNIYPYGAMYAFNRERSASEVQYDYVSWPSAGYFPQELFAPDDAWSVSLNPDKYDNTRTGQISVNLTRIRDGRSWSFSAQDTNKSGKYFNVEKSGYGIPFCIIFRPDGISAFEDEDTFKVDIRGIYSKGGAETAISFETTMFDLLAQASFRTESIQLIPGEQLQLYTGINQADKESGLAPQFTSSNPEVAAVDQDGTITAKRSGSATISANQYFNASEPVYVSVKTADPKDRVSAWAQDAYSKAKANGIVAMSSDSKYQTPVNRYTFAKEALKVYENIAGKVSSTTASPFKDIQDSRITLAYELNLIKGTSATAFSPWKTVTRQEAATMLSKLVQILDERTQTASSGAGVSVTPFKDDSGIASWAKDAVYASVRLGLLNGIGNNKFQPLDNLTLEQSYVILQNLLDRYE
ncbi:S-layer homology domain-containing protein [Paenibacillus sp. NFR01]|uniref:S-layer homology domain-containing protein n=1 Tax=Paenibacillus sp. NFR01 TaxID=1566279 RepID=UPI0008CAB814|nr:S-layer homology domain-containing protein [Paenibacillus sp. NFR01]SEU28067.1 S-layer homology domain-containing protein [Paenibacillus sp. NFR01]